MLNKQLTIGITGGIGSGKSAVTTILRKLGYPVVDADEISRGILDPGTDAYDKTVDTFGVEIVLEGGSINRPLLGKIIFNDDSKREKLNSIVHPAVYAIINEQVEMLKKEHSLLFVDVPLLYENNRDDDYDEVWVVYANDTIRIKRICKRDQVDESYALVKINAQMPLEEKMKRATRVIDNMGSLSELESRVLAILRTINK